MLATAAVAVALTTMSLAGGETAVTDPAAVAAAMSNATERASAFAAPALWPALRRPTLEVAEAVEVKVGSAAPMPVRIDGFDDAAAVRVRYLPAYAGLSAGVPQDGGSWLIDPAAARQLQLTAYAVSEAPQDVTVEVLDGAGRTLAATRTRMVFVDGKTPSPARTTVAAEASMPAAPVQPRSPIVINSVATIPLEVPRATPAARPNQHVEPAPEVAAKPAPTRSRVAKRTTEPTQAAVEPPAPPPVVAAAPTPKPPSTFFGLFQSASPTAPSATAQQPSSWLARWHRSALGMNQSGP